MKKYLTLIVCSIILCSCGDLGQSEKQRQEEQRQNYIKAINAVLKADKEATRLSNGDATLNASKMRNIYIGECPSEFSAAYIEHIQAWEYSGKLQRAKKEQKEKEGGAVIEGVLSTLFKSKATPFSDHLAAERELNQLAIKANEEVVTTWYAVERVAVSYGATLPQ